MSLGGLGRPESEPDPARARGPWRSGPPVSLLRPPLRQRSALPMCINVDPTQSSIPGEGSAGGPCLLRFAVSRVDKAALAPALGWRPEGPAIPMMAKLAGRGLASDSGPGKPALGRAAFLGDRPAGPWGPPCPVLDLTV